MQATDSADQTVATADDLEPFQIRLPERSILSVLHGPRYNVCRGIDNFLDCELYHNRFRAEVDSSTVSEGCASAFFCQEEFCGIRLDSLVCRFDRIASG